MMQGVTLHPYGDIQTDKREDKQLFEPTLDSKEAARLLRIHPKALQRMARAGEVPGMRIGKRWKFRASTLDLYLESRYTQNSICAA